MAQAAAMPKPTADVAAFIDADRETLKRRFLPVAMAWDQGSDVGAVAAAAEARALVLEGLRAVRGEDVGILLAAATHPEDVLSPVFWLIAARNLQERRASKCLRGLSDFEASDLARDWISGAHLLARHGRAERAELALLGAMITAASTAKPDADIEEVLSSKFGPEAVELAGELRAQNDDDNGWQGAWHSRVADLVAEVAGQ